MISAKKELRLFIKEKLRSFTIQELETKSSLLSENLLNFLQRWEKEGLHSQRKREALCIGGFCPLPDEPKWHLQLRGVPLNLAFPRVQDHELMEFRLCPMDQLVEQNVCGVCVKSPSAEMEKVVPEIILIPGQAFGPQGERLGRGKGYYDRYLNTYTGTKIGICFNEQILSNIPTQPHDQKVDVIITDTKVIKVKV